MSESNIENSKKHYTIYYAQEKNYFPQEFFDIITKEIIIEEGLDAPFELGLALVSNEDIQKLNKKFRGKDYPTDVLAFREKDSKDSWPEDSPENHKEEYLGDIIISVEKAEKQAVEHNKTFEEEVAFLYIHGFYHLLGYDHERSEEDEKIMNQKTESVHNKLTDLQ